MLSVMVCIQKHLQMIQWGGGGGLLKTLYICVGCKVMLTCNLNVKFGLFNGSSGTVMDIVYPVGKFPKDGHPICVMVCKHG
jgi:Fe-S-cluster-containing dehydrogenase component